MLGIQPTKAYNAGERVFSPSGRRSRIAPRSVWKLESEQFVESKDLRHHLDWLLNILRAHSEGLKRVQALPGVTMVVKCRWYSAVGHGGPALWPKQMAVLAELDLELAFEIQFHPDSLVFTDLQ